MESDAKRGGGKTNVPCPCGSIHKLSPTAMALIIEAYGAGELHTVGGKSVETLCYLRALRHVDEERKAKYRGVVSFNA